MNILIDIGNSRIKWATEQAGVINSYPALDYRHIDLVEELLPVWQQLSEPKTLIIASVGTHIVKQTIIDLALNLWPNINLINPSSSQTAFGVNNAYLHPEKLGIDRWLTLLAAHQHYPGYSCIVDCGTAITLDVLTSQGYHLGGLICPGLNLMKHTLLKNTAGLSFSSHNANASLASHTTGAIANGILFAAIGMIEAVYQRLDTPAQLILTGGDAEIVSEYLQISTIIDSDLVFKGLSIIGQSA